MQDAVLIDGRGTIYHNKIMGVRKHSKDIKKFCLVQIWLTFSGRKE
jgi:hypothetical protein